MENENVFLLYALIMGAYITFVYDSLRVFRRVIPHGSLLISLEDLGFWIYCAAKVFVLMYHESNGMLRWFAVFGALVGMLVYKKLVSPFFVGYVTLILRKLLQILGNIGSCALRPLIHTIRKAQRTARQGKIRALRRRTEAKWLLKKKLTFLRKMLK